MGAVLSLVHLWCMPRHALLVWFVDKRWRSVVIIGVFVVSSALAALHKPVARLVRVGRRLRFFCPVLDCWSRQEIPLTSHVIVCTLAQRFVLRH